MDEDECDQRMTCSCQACCRRGILGKVVGKTIGPFSCREKVGRDGGEGGGKANEGGGYRFRRRDETTLLITPQRVPQLDSFPSHHFHNAKVQRFVQASASGFSFELTNLSDVSARASQNPSDRRSILFVLVEVGGQSARHAKRDRERVCVCSLCYEESGPSAGEDLSHIQALHSVSEITVRSRWC